MTFHRRTAVYAAALACTSLAIAGCSSTNTTGTATPKASSALAAQPSVTSAPTQAPVSTPAASTVNAQPVGPQVVEDGWSLSSDGSFVTFGVHVRNTGPATNMPYVTVTAVDGNGAPLETKKNTLGYLGVGADAYVGGTFTDSADIADLQITTEPGQRPTPTQAVSITAEATIRGTGYSPRISMTAQSDSTAPVPSPATIYLVFRNESSEIVGGTFAYTQSSIPPSGTLNEAPFITGFAPDDTTSVEATIAATIF